MLCGLCIGLWGYRCDVWSGALYERLLEPEDVPPDARRIRPGEVRAAARATGDEADLARGVEADFHSPFL